MTLAFNRLTLIRFLIPVGYYFAAGKIFSFLNFRTVWDAVILFGPTLYFLGLLHVLIIELLHQYLKAEDAYNYFERLALSGQYWALNFAGLVTAVVADLKSTFKWSHFRRLPPGKVI